jgi:hypothetical protein
MNAPTGIVARFATIGADITIARSEIHRHRRLKKVTPDWQLWRRGPALAEVSPIRPVLASWDAKTHPSQVRLQAFLLQITTELGSHAGAGDPLYLHLDVNVEDKRNLLRHHDLENYLTPLVGGLGARKFVLASATKSVGGGSRLVLGRALDGADLQRRAGWHSFSCEAGAGAQRKSWKEGLRTSLRDAGVEKMPDGPVEVQLAWRCSPSRNWVWLWKPTGDAMGPVLGEPDGMNPFNPADDRIVSLVLHLNADPHMKHDVRVGMWWRAAGTRGIADSGSDVAAR